MDCDGPRERQRHLFPSASTLEINMFFKGFRQDQFHTPVPKAHDREELRLAPVTSTHGTRWRQIQRLVWRFNYTDTAFLKHQALAVYTRM